MKEMIQFYYIVDKTEYNVLLYARPEPEQEVRPPPYPSLVL